MSETTIQQEPLDSRRSILGPLKRLEPIKKNSDSSLIVDEDRDDDLFSPQVQIQPSNHDSKVEKERRKKAYKKMLKSRENYENAQDTYRKKYERAEEEYNKVLDKYNKALIIAEDEYNKAIAYYRSLFPTTKGGKTRRVKSRGRKTRKYY
jgi:hypothetical protein